MKQGYHASTSQIQSDLLKDVKRMSLVGLAKDCGIAGWENHYRSPYRNMAWLYDEINKVSNTQQPISTFSTSSTSSTSSTASSNTTNVNNSINNANTLDMPSKQKIKILSKHVKKELADTTGSNKQKQPKIHIKYRSQFDKSQFDKSQFDKSQFDISQFDYLLAKAESQSSYNLATTHETEKKEKITETATSEPIKNQEKQKQEQEKKEQEKKEQEGQKKEQELKLKKQKKPLEKLTTERRNAIMQDYKSYWTETLGVDRTKSQLWQVGREREIRLKYGGLQGLRSQRLSEFTANMRTKVRNASVIRIQRALRDSILGKCENLAPHQLVGIDPLCLIRLRVGTHCVGYNVQRLYNGLISQFGGINNNSWIDPTYNIPYTPNQIKRIKNTWSKSRPGSSARSNLENLLALLRS